ncbi:Glutathione S-transferase [Nymphaea thermarum]|nr:Glutathione S-transferase [Nymphaea thermarum]
MAAPIKVFGPAMSTATARVLACLLESQLQFDLVPVDMSKGQHKKPEFLGIQPFGQVPAFQDEHISLFESRAICRYIVDKYTEKGKRGLLGMETLERASIEQWLEAESQSFNPPSSALVFQLAFAPRMKLKQDPNLIAQNEAKLSKVLDVYEQRLGDSRFLAGDEFTLADLSHLPNAQYLINATDRAALFTSRKNVNRWWEEISGRTSWKKVVEMQQTPLPSSSST